MHRFHPVSIFVLASLAAASAACSAHPRGDGTPPDSGTTPDGGADDLGAMPDAAAPDLGGDDLGAMPDAAPPPPPRCGDMRLDPGEQCDFGGVDTPTCDADCTLPACGDGHRNHPAGEECDDGPGGSPTCSTDCRSLVPAVCGDGVLEGGEACDDGNTSTGDGCDASCAIEPGFTCAGMPSACMPLHRCGDGSLDPGEGCDDGNGIDGDGCSSSCDVEPGYACSGVPSTCVAMPPCGDGLLELGETCDDGNVINGDGCDAECLSEEYVGVDRTGFDLGVMLDSTLTWTRPYACGLTSGHDVAHYASFVIENVDSIPLTFSFSTYWPSGGTGITLVYAPPFVDTMPTVDCAGDSTTTATSPGPVITGIPIAAGAQVVLVVSELTLDGDTGIPPITVQITASP